MRILITINDEKQAEKFLIWVLNRGDILLGDLHEIVMDMQDGSAKPYVYIADAAEVSKNDENRDSSSNSGTTNQISYSKPSPY